MKVGITTTLSIIGVIAAGVTAFAVNSRVLNTSASSASGFSDPVTSSIAEEQTIPSSQDDEQSITVESSVLSNNQVSYQVGNSGSVVIDTASGKLTVSNVLPAAGWSSEPVQVQPNGDVKVRFVSTTARIEFLAQLIGGKMSTNVVSEPLLPQEKPAVTSPPTKPSIPFSGDDDDGGGDGGDGDDD